MQKYEFSHEYYLKCLLTVHGRSTKRRKQNCRTGKTLKTNWSMNTDESTTLCNDSVLDVRIA